MICYISYGLFLRRSVNSVNRDLTVYLEKASLAAESSSPRAFLNDCNLIFLLSLAVDWVE